MFPVETGGMRVAAHPQPMSCGILHVSNPYLAREYNVNTP